MRIQDNRYPESAKVGEAAVSPVLSIDRDAARDNEQLLLHAHPESMLTWSATATLVGTVAGRDWLIPPGYGLWVPGGIEHSGAVLHAGDMVSISFAAGSFPLSWAEPTAFAVGPLLGEIITHLRGADPDDPTRATAETLMFQLLTPLPAHHIHISLPTDPRARQIAEHLLAHPDDQRDLTSWAGCVHSSVRTLSRLFLAETGLTFTAWRTHVRIRTAIPILARGTPVSATAHAVGYRKPSAFIAAFQRSTGHTPGTYLLSPSG